jgi:hypothetical protein
VAASALSRLPALAARQPRLIVIEPLGDDRRPPTPVLVERVRFDHDGSVYRVGSVGVVSR